MTVESKAFSVSIRRLTEVDIPFAMELKNIAGWNQIESDWRRYMELEPNGCFIAEVDGRKAGTATAIQYGRKVGWIGMVLVHPDMRRYGIGTALLKQTIGYLQQLGVESIKLDATPMGKKVYVPLGFEDEYDLTRYEGTVEAAQLEQVASEAVNPADRLAGEAANGMANPSGGYSASGGSGLVQPITEDLLEELIAFDAVRFGVDRREVLGNLAAAGASYGCCIRENGQVVGYLMAHDGYEAIQAGPWVADSPEAAEMLFTAFLAKAVGRKVFLDVPVPNTAGTAMMEKYGFTVQRGFARMALGRSPVTGRLETIYGTSGAEKG
jgi:GNAT superfamily N-acetyltransferase